MSMIRQPGDGRSSTFDWPAYLVVTIAGSMVSMAITGFLFGTNNNVFHLPITAKLYDEPQFAQDAFIQSLRYYSSGLWLALQRVPPWVDTTYLFFAVACLSRFIYFAGFVACATLLGVRGRKERALFTALICSAILLRACSYAGGDNLFSNYCTHSDIANGLFLVALYFVVQGRIAIAIALAGLIFSINLFKGVWVASVFAVVILAQLLGGTLSWRQGIVRGVIGVCGASIFAAPVLAVILSKPELGKPLTFDYIAYLNEYFPHHFLFNSNPLREKIALLFLAATGGSALLVVGKSARLMVVALAAICTIYLFGAIVPKLSQSPLTINLHLLRISGLIQMLSILAVSSLATLWFFDPERAKNILAPVMIAGISTPFFISVAIVSTFVIAAYALADKELKIFKRFVLSRIPDAALALRAAAVLLILFSIPYTAYRLNTANLPEKEWIGEWRQIAFWARDNTSPYSVFLVPPGNFGQENTIEKEAGLGGSIFEFASHRRVWVEFKRGAAAMWIPSYYHEWHQRIAEVFALSTHEDRLEYARQHGVSYVVELCSGQHREDAISATARLCVYPAFSAGQAAGVAPTKL